jgi:signal transduction histidine kinase
MQQKIFEPFFTTKPVGQGTGLGLDISYRVIAQRHGGDIRVVSRPGDTRFQVRLPLTEPPSFG